MSRAARPIAVALLSASTLTYEILLVRVFAIEHFHHFAYMAIGVAMLGYGAAGTLLALYPVAGATNERAWFRRTAVLTPLALTLSAIAVHVIRLDATQLVWSPASWVTLSFIYIFLALPFGVAAAAILIALSLAGERPGSLYGASFVGAGLGAGIALAVLWALLPARALAVPGALAALGALAAVSDEGSPRGWRFTAFGTLALALAILARPFWSIDVSIYKGLPQVEAFPNAKRVAETTSPLGWVVAVDAEAFRYAPGLSLAFTGELPRQRAVFVDGELAGALAHSGSWAEGSDYLEWLPSSAPYALGRRERVAIIGAGGGTEIANALLHGASRVVALELHRDLAELARRSAEPARIAWRNGLVEWIVGEARGSLGRSSERFDLIALPAGGRFGSGAAGLHSLGEDFLHTAEAYEGYLERLGADGVLVVTRWLTIPPRGSVRAVLTAVEALRRSLPSGTDDGLIVVRSWATVTILVKPSGFSESETVALTSWARERRFDLDWYPGISEPRSEFNFLDEATLYRAAEAAVAGDSEARAFAAEYAFDVAPASDARPYPQRFLRSASLRHLGDVKAGTWIPFAEWGYVALFATLFQSVALGAVFTLAPAALRARTIERRSWLEITGYFGALGFGYLAAEIAAIQQLSLLLGHPVYAVAGALAVFLVCSGAGSAASDRIAPAGASRAPAAIAVALTLYALLMLGLVHLLLPWPLIARGVAALSAVAPLGFVLGMPFPLGLRLLASGSANRTAWAWTANGFASAIAAPTAALIAVDVGSPALFGFAAAAYGAAALIARPQTRRSRAAAAAF